MKKILLFISFSLIALLSNAQWIHDDISSGIKFIYNYQLIVHRQDSSLDVNLKVVDSREPDTIDLGNILLNVQTVSSNDEQMLILKNKYSELVSSLGKQKLIDYSQPFANMISSIRDTISKRNELSYVYQALRMYYKVVKGSLRDNSPKQPVSFTIFGGFDIAICSFDVQEDLIFNIADVRNYLINRKATDRDNPGIDYYLNALSNETATTLSMKEINARLETLFAGRYPQGGQCGCCFNYPGNCYYWNSICLAHDMACQRCQWDACFGGCVPSSCSGNSISWYWFLL